MSIIQVSETAVETHDPRVVSILKTPPNPSLLESTKTLPLTISTTQTKEDNLLQKIYVKRFLEEIKYNNIIFTEQAKNITISYNIING